MNLNEYPEKLKIEEQAVLNRLISEMDEVIDDLDKTAKEYVKEAKNADLSINLDHYLGVLLAKKGIKDTERNRKELLKARDELYRYRLLLKCSDEIGTEIIEKKVGLHSCNHGAEQFVISWKMPLCRHYLLDKSSVDYETVVTDKLGRKCHTQYKLLVKNEVKLRFTRAVSAANLFPGLFSEEDLRTLSGTGFFSSAFLDEMIESFNPYEYDPEKAADIIADEFLQELLERRSSPEFKNIVFSIQKKQGEIIQAPYRRNMVVQGCAGSGKSMIMLHRLPILLYDNPSSLSRTKLYIITPSQMYIQLAENMRHQLEISDINMGTIAQYYDHCIAKYSGHKPQEYGKIDYGNVISPESEQYIYSSQCVEDIRRYFEEQCTSARVPLDMAFSVLKIKESNSGVSASFAQAISSRILKLQSVLVSNDAILNRNFKRIIGTTDALKHLRDVLRNRKEETLREISKKISEQKTEIVTAEKELKKLESEGRAVAVQNRLNIIEAANKHISDLNSEKAEVEAADDFFATLLKIATKIDSVLAPFKGLAGEYSQSGTKEIYSAIDNIGYLIGGYSMLTRELSKLGSRYEQYLGAVKKATAKLGESIVTLQSETEECLDYDYYAEIKAEEALLSEASSKAIKNAYEFVLNNIGIKPNKNGSMPAAKCSPYVHLQILYQYSGKPSSSGAEALLAIDEAQGLAVEELRLISNINGGNVILNLYGDVNQHIEGTKGIDSWDEFRGVLDFDSYEMQENYRNASQITEYCNRVFKMNMQAINTPGKGVHELHTDEEFQTEMECQLLDSQRAGISAILVGCDAEAKYLLDRFSSYEQKFHDMTGEEFSIHRTRWNIIKIDDAKGLEFSSVIVLSGRMSHNQRYIAFTRALDDLYVYSEPVDITKYESEQNEPDDDSLIVIDDRGLVGGNDNVVAQSRHEKNTVKKTNSESAVKKFFEENGLKAIDRRAEDGRIWVIGEKDEIRGVVNKAISKFGISGKYIQSEIIGNKNGWYTKTDK